MSDQPNTGEYERPADRLTAEDDAALRALARMTVPVNRFTLAEHVEGTMKPSYYSVRASLGRLRALGLAELDERRPTNPVWWITDEGRAALGGDSDREHSGSSAGGPDA